MIMISTFADYEAGMEDARAAFNRNPAIIALFHRPIDSDRLEAFLIHFSAIGVAMTEPVAAWITRAGERCSEVGLDKLGRALRAHAGQEDGHHILMQQDTRALVSRWNRNHTPQLDAARLLTLEPADGVIRYKQVHENAISGNAPYGQLAIEYEIERLSIVYGPQLLGICSSTLESDALDGLSFLRDHVELDVAHTKFNQSQLSRLLEEHPAFLGGLVAAGSGALDAYSRFLSDCLAMADTVTTGALA
jgi:hypothetical protein